MNEQKEYDVKLKALRASRERYQQIISGEFGMNSVRDIEFCVSKNAELFPSNASVHHGCPCCMVSSYLHHQKGGSGKNSCTDCLISDAVQAGVVPADGDAGCLMSYYHETWEDVLNDLKTIEKWVVKTNKMETEELETVDTQEANISQDLEG